MQGGNGGSHGSVAELTSYEPGRGGRTYALMRMRMTVLKLTPVSRSSP